MGAQAAPSGFARYRSPNGPVQLDGRASHSLSRKLSKAPASRWNSSEFMNCEVSAAAFERGYGTAEEITVIRRPQQEWSVDVSRYLRDSKSTPEVMTPLY